MLEVELSPLRAGRVTGSRIAGILGFSPYTNRAGVMRSMVRQHFGAEQEFTGNIATDYGTLHELEAIGDYEIDRGVMTELAGTVVHPRYDYLAATPDGLVGEDGVLEVKCPWKGKYQGLDERLDYAAQVQLEIACTGREWCDFVVWRDEQPMIIERVNYDPGWLPGVLPQVQDFMEEYETTIHDEALAAPHLDALKDLRTDGEWSFAAAAYLDAAAGLDKAKAVADEARKDLLALTVKPAVGGGVQVIRSERAGNVDYARLLKDHGITDVDEYRKPATTVWTVRRSA